MQNPPSSNPPAPSPQKKCRKCDSDMVKRKHSKTGTEFWVCSQWPKCKRSGEPYVDPTTGHKSLSFEERLNLGIRRIEL